MNISKWTLGLTIVGVLILVAYVMLPSMKKKSSNNELVINPNYAKGGK